MEPPDSLASSTAYRPSAGLPIASERTIVSGERTGSISREPAAQAVATGAQPAAWPPTKRIGRRSIRPSSASSSKPRATRVNMAPDATGATTTSGERQPSDSAISNASVLEPSA